MKALCVFSGGLDSLLAAESIRAQGIDVLALFFETPFFSSQKPRKSAESIDLPFKVVDITERHLEVVKKPKHGYGGNMNPCIDCHSLMFRIAGEMLKQEGADFILTGEVLGQRPMSQNKKSLTIVAAESGYGELLLRPLSALCLTPTTPEKKGWVKRDLLMGFQGRTRKPQMAMAKKLGITDYPAPAGGCRLTESAFSHRLKDLFNVRKDPEIRHIKLLKVGRHFKLAHDAKLIVGRNKKENETIRSLSRDRDLILTSAHRPGPTVLGHGDFSDDLLEIAAAITAAYSDAEEGTETEVRVVSEAGEKILRSRSPQKDEFKEYLL